MLLSIAGGSDLGLFEINEAAALVSQAAHAEANIIFGATIDDALGDEVRVTVIAAGFDGGMPKRRDEGTVLRREPRRSRRQAETRRPPSSWPAGQPRTPGAGAARPAPVPAADAGRRRSPRPAAAAAGGRRAAAAGRSSSTTTTWTCPTS